jgi:hypothetical protein
MRWFVFAILLACGGEKSPPQTGSGSDNPGATKVAVPGRPVLPDAATPNKPSLPDQGSGKTTDTVFESEVRDGGWAGEVESKIQERFAKVRGAKLASTECRQTQCRLTIVGSEGDLAQTIADLESHRGLHGYAKNVLLTAPAKKADGTLELRAFAIFER